MSRIIWPVACVILALGSMRADAAIISSDLDFDNPAIWSLAITTSSTAGDGGSGSIGSGTGLTADKGSGSGGVRLTATLIGSLSTVGFNDIFLTFTNSAAGGMEFDGINLAAVNSTDGFIVASTQGLSFTTNTASGLFKTALEPGTTWNPTNAITFGQDLTFDSSAENGSITNLVFILQVDANAEVVSLSGITLNGTAIASPSVPEPAGLTLAASALGLCVLRRFRRHR